MYDVRLLLVSVHGTAGIKRDAVRGTSKETRLLHLLKKLAPVLVAVLSCVASSAGQ